MKFSPFLVLFFTLSLQAADAPKAPAKPAPKPKLNTQIYEQENEEISFEATVKVVREIQGETDVFFEGQQGFYILTNDSLQSLLVKSQQKKIPVQVQVNSTSRQILKVVLGAKN